MWTCSTLSRRTGTDLLLRHGACVEADLGALRGGPMESSEPVYRGRADDHPTSQRTKTNATRSQNL